MPAKTIDEIRDRAEVLFGPRYSVEVLCAIAELDPDRISLSDVSEALSVPLGKIQTAFGWAARAGLIVQRKADGQSRRTYFSRIESAAFLLAAEVVGVKPDRAVATLKRLAAQS